jgi:hypothetical protein
MYFYGTDRGKDWKAELNVIEFAKKYASVVCKF